MSYFKLSLIFTLASFLLAFLLWLCHDLLSGVELQIKVNILLISCQCTFDLSMYLVVVEEVHEYLHDTREDHQDGRGDEEGVDVVK